MSEIKSQESGPGHEPTADDIRELTGAATPQFAQQIRSRVLRLIQNLPPNHPVRAVGDREARNLEKLALEGEGRGQVQEDERLMPSLGSGTASHRR